MFGAGTRSRTAATSPAVRSGYGFGPLDRLDQDRSADRCSRLGRQSEVLGREIILLPGCQVAHAIAVQRIEGRYAESFADMHRHGNVVRNSADRAGMDNTVSARRNPGKEVQSDQLDSGIAYGCDELVDLGVGRRG